MLNPPLINEPERVATIWRTPKDKRVEGFVSYLDLQDWQAESRSFESIAAYKPNDFTLITNGQAERVFGLRVTANFLSFLKVPVFRGRDFQYDEEKRGAQGSVVLSHQFWQNRFGANESAIGEQMTLNGRPFIIIGVLPPDFAFPLAVGNTELLTTIAGEGGNLDERGAQVLKAMGRLKSGATFEQAQAEMNAIAENLAERYPRYSSDASLYLVPVDEKIVGRDLRRALWLLLGAVGFILLIACTNMTNLMLVRASARQKEMALRLALGAGVWRIARHLLTESLLLSLISGGAGLMIAVWGLSEIRFFGEGQLPRLDEVQINNRILLFTLAVAGAKNATSGRSLKFWRNSLVVAEVALGLALLIGAGLMIQSFSRLINVNPGFDPENVLTGRVSMARDVYEDTN